MGWLWIYFSLPLLVMDGYFKWFSNTYKYVYIWLWLVHCMPCVCFDELFSEIQLWPCGTFMANGWYMMENMTRILTYWLATSSVGNWGVTVGIRAVVHGPCHRVC